MAAISRACLWPPGCMVCWLIVAAGARGDIVYLKDGTVLYGRVIQEQSTLTDSVTGQTLPVPKGNNVYAVYDGTRIIAFSPHQLDPNRPAVKDDYYANLVRLERNPKSKPFNRPPAGIIDGKLAFDEKGKRRIVIRTQKGPYYIDQMLTFLSPFQLRVFSLEYAWTQNYLTSELDPELVRSLALNFPQIKDEKDPVEKRFKWYRFMLDSRWLDAAARELDDIEKSLPQSKERVEKARVALKHLDAQANLDFAAHALSMGQMRVCQSFLDRIPKQGLDAELNVKVTTLRVKVDGIARQYDQAMRYLRLLPDDAQGRCAEVLCDAASVLRDELHIDALDRLEPFIVLAEQAEKARKAGRDPADKPEQLLARAITGWLLGKESSDARPEVARRLWRAREMAATYIRTPLVRDRNALLTRYEKNEPVEIEELARIIALLPPAALEEAPPGDRLSDPQKRQTDLPSPNHVKVDYAIQLPPEYKPGRPYPMLVVLHNDNESPEKVLMRYRYEAVRNGYILVAPEWGGGFGGKYQYDPEERQRVLDVIRDVRMRFHVDADRVFLSGWGEGGTAAWDIGLSHPDLFAAVVPIAGDPKRSLLWRYWPNAIHLPFYLVNGEYGGESMQVILKIMEFWINKGFPCLNVIYQGRGSEWFHGELPYAFEWMNRRKRNHPFPELGRWPIGENTALATMRPSNNRFYWLSTDGIKDAYMQSDRGYPENAAQLQAMIKPGNYIEVSTFGLKQVTVWLGAGMIDFTRPVTVKLKGYREREAMKYNGGKPLKADLSLLMEDFLERGDNTRLFVARLNLTP